MNALLAGMARGVSRWPVAMIAVVALGTVVLGVLGAQQDVETDITEFSADSDTAQVFDRVEERFGARGSSVQVIVDAGPGGDVLSADGLRVADRVAEISEETPEVAEHLERDTDRSPAVVGYADSVLGQLEAFDIEAAELTDSFAEALVADVLDSPQGSQLEGLASDDLEDGRARGGLVIVSLAPDATEQESRAAGLALVDALEREDFGWLDADPFSFEILSADIEDGMLDDLPVLLGVSFALIIVILAFLFRRTSDVLLGVLGLVLTILWMQGFSVLLGPEYLQITGPFNQIAIAVPVLLVGLGIDYSVHLNARYGEERTGGADSGAAASTAVRTVGVALLLATITTVIGFLANLATPLPPIADFGAFAAAGIASAFVVMGLLVPSARTLLDRRRDRLDAERAAASPEPGSPGVDALTAEGPEAGPRQAPVGSRPMHALALLPARAPLLALLGAVAVAAVAGLAATGIDTSFSQDEFIPEDSTAADLLERQDDLFGGDVSEQTYALVEGDLTDPSVFEAMAEVEDELAELDDVVMAGDEADVPSPRSVVASLDQQIEAAQLQLSSQFQLLADPEAGAADLPLPEDLTVDDLPDGLLDEANRDFAPDDELAGDVPLDEVELDELEQRLPEGVSAEDALLAALPGAELASQLRAGFAEQLEDEGPVGLDDEELQALADLEASELDLEVLDARGYPLEDLDEGTRELLDAGDDLAALGWTGDGVADDADMRGLYALANDLLGGDVEAVLSEDGDAGLLIIATQAGEDRAERLTEQVDAALAPLSARGAEAAVASEQLLVSETLDELTNAQVGAILISLGAALALLVTYYGFTARRPALGLVTMLPPLLAVPLILGTMRGIGLSFNALTATVASIAVGIGVPYGIHLTNRYLEQRRRGGDTASVIRGTVVHTGAALVGSAVTTASAFGVLGMSNLEPIRQFGIVTSITIVYALMAAIVAETSALVLWDRYHRWQALRREPDTVQVHAGDGAGSRAGQPVGATHPVRVVSPPHDAGRVRPAPRSKR